MREISKEPRGAEVWSSFTVSILSSRIVILPTTFWRGRAVHLIFYTVFYLLPKAVGQFHACHELGLENCLVMCPTVFYSYSVAKN
jgi:hypothetical protein